MKIDKKNRLVLNTSEFRWFNTEHIKCKEELEKFLSDANGRAKVRTIGVGSLESSLRKFRDMMARYGFSSTTLSGTSWYIDFWGQKFPSAYTRKGRPESTIIHLEIKNGKYILRFNRNYSLSNDSWHLVGNPTEEMIECFKRELE